jgi:hypothetical protein
MILVALFIMSASPEPAFKGPTPKDFADAVAAFTGKAVKVTNVRHLSCGGFGADEPTEAECSWQQRIGSKWKRYSTYVAVDGDGWHLIDAPYLKR